MRHSAYSRDGQRRQGRGFWPLLLAGIGVFALVLAAFFRFYVPGQAIKFPLNEYEIMTLQGTGASYFSAKQVTELSGVTMRATYTIKGEVAKSQALGRSDVAIWESFVAVQDVTNHAPFQYTYWQLALNRRTGQIMNGYRANELGKQHNLALSGQSYVWPFNTAKHGYKLFDPNARRAVPVSYAGTATTDGIATYRFVESVSGLRIGSQVVPGSLIGSAAPSVTLPEYYTAHITYFVDPVTGDPIKMSENELVTLRDAAGATKLVLIRAHLATTPASLRTLAATDRSNVGQIQMIGTVIPLAGLVLGVILLGTGLALSRRPRRDEGAGTDELAGRDASAPEPVPLGR